MDLTLVCEGVAHISPRSAHEVTVGLYDVDPCFIDSDQVAEEMPIERFLRVHGNEMVAEEIDDKILIEVLENRGYDVTMGGEK